MLVTSVLSLYVGYSSFQFETSYYIALLGCFDIICNDPERKR